MVKTRRVFIKNTALTIMALQTANVLNIKTNASVQDMCNEEPDDKKTEILKNINIKEEGKVLFAADNEILADKVNKWCYNNKIGIEFSNDIFQWGSYANIVDRHYIEASWWIDFCNIFAKPGTIKTPSAYRDPAILNSYGEFYFKIIIVDNNIQKSIEEWPIMPYLRKEDLYLIEQSNQKEIIDTLDNILLNI